MFSLILSPLFLVVPQATAGELQQPIACPAAAVELAWAAKRDGVVAQFNELGAEFSIVHDVVVDVGPCDSRLVVSYSSVADELIQGQLAEKLSQLFADVDECRACQGTVQPASSATSVTPSTGAKSIEVSTNCLAADAQMLWDRVGPDLGEAFAKSGIELHEASISPTGRDECRSKLTFSYGPDRNSKVDDILGMVGKTMQNQAVCIVGHKRCLGLQPNGTPLGLEWRCERYYLRARHPYAEGWRTQSFCAYPSYREDQVGRAVGNAMCSDDVGTYRSFGSYSTCHQGIECRKTSEPCSTPGRVMGEMRQGRR